MSIFPVEIQQEILSYVPLLDKLEYARCNRYLCREFMARLRIITLRKEKMEYLTSESFRKKILGLIVDPYEQLEILSKYPSVIDLSDSSLLGSNLALRTLVTNSKDFPLLSPHITQVQHLVFTLRKGHSEVKLPRISGLRQLSLISDPGWSSHLSLKDQLNRQLDLRSLTYLKLKDCHSITDISSLGHIYELHLISCFALVDISCLNHNKIIVIDSCPVVDYSQSFRFSRDITVSLYSLIYNSDRPLIKGINLDNLEVVRSLSTDFDRMDITDPLSYTESLPSSLRYLSLKGMISSFLVPLYHNLKEITLSNCWYVCLKNLEKVRSVKIEFCDYIRDWSPLERNKNIEIVHCAGFKSGKQFTNVKKLILMDSTLANFEDLTNITHLKLKMDTSAYLDRAIPYITSSTRGEELFSSANNLQEIECVAKYPDLEVPLLHSILKSLHHERIIINLVSVDKDSFETYHRRIVKDFNSFYQVEFKPPMKLVLLKRDQKERKEKRSLFSSWSITSMIDYFRRR